MITYVQSAVNSLSNSQSISTAYSSNNTAGNFLIACIHVFNNNPGDGFSGGVTSITDTQGNTWVKALEWTAFVLGYDLFWYVENCKAGPNTVTANFGGSGASTYPSMTVLEYSGVALSSSLDVMNHNSGSGTAASSGSITTTASDLVITLSDNVTGPVMETPAGGWNVRQTSGGTVTDQVFGPGSIQYTSTWASSVQWLATILSFKSPTVASGSSQVGAFLVGI